MRTNFHVYREAVALTDKQLGTSDQVGVLPCSFKVQCAFRMQQYAPGKHSVTMLSSCLFSQLAGHSPTKAARNSTENSTHMKTTPTCQPLQPHSATLHVPLTPAPPQGATPSPAVAPALKLRRGRLLLSNFALLRTKLSAPHPLWILINPLVQLPVFVLLGGGLRLMAGMHWPGLEQGGALWFQDLTQAGATPRVEFTLSDFSVLTSVSRGHECAICC